MVDAAFVWTTNIGEVAQQISSGLSRIRADVQRGMAGAGTGSLRKEDLGFVPAGIENRIARVAKDLDNNLKRVAANYGEGLERAAKRGTPFQGVKVGGEYTTDFRKAAAAQVALAQKSMAQIGKDVSQAFTGPLSGMRADVLRQVDLLARGVTSGADKMVRTLAQGGEYRGREYEGLTALRDRLRPRLTSEGRMDIAGGLRPADLSVLSRGISEGIASVDLSRVSAAESIGALDRLIKAGGGGDFSASGEDIYTDLQRQQKKVATGFSEMERVINDVRENLKTTLGPRGEPQFGRAIYDAQGNLVSPSQMETGRRYTESRARIEDGPDGRTYFDRRGVGFREEVDPESGQSLGFQQIEAKTTAQLLREAQDLVGTGEAGPKLRDVLDSEIDDRQRALANQRAVNDRLESVSKDRTALEERASKRRAAALEKELIGGARTREVELGQGYARRGEEYFRFTRDGAVPVAAGSRDAIRAEQDIARTRVSAEKEAYQLRSQMIRDDERAARTRSTQLERDLVREASLGRAIIAGRFARTDDGEMYRFMGDSGRAARVEPGTRTYMRAEQEIERELFRRAEVIRKENVRQASLPPQPVRPTGTSGQTEGSSRFGTLLRTAAGEGSVRGLNFESMLMSGFSLLRYTISAAAIGGGIAALITAKDAVVDYRDSLTDLEVALRITGGVQESFVSSLSDVARIAGANTGDAIDAAVRGVRAFGPVSGDRTQRESAFLGTKFAQTASQLAVVAEKSLVDATGDLIAIGSAFDLTTETFGRALDAVAVAKRELGGDAGEIAQGLAAVGTSAAEVGFTLEETANLISLVQSRTDQSGRAIATRLSRAFSIIGGSQGRSAIERLNRELEPSLQIDTSGTVRDQLMEISNLYGDLSMAQQGLIRNALGGAANTRELIPIISNPDALREAMDAQLSGSGTGLDEFQRKSDDLVGILRKIRGNVEGIFTGLFRAGAFAPFEAAIRGAEGFLNAIRNITNEWNNLISIFSNADNSVANFAGTTAKYLGSIGVQVLMLQKLLNSLRNEGLIRNLTAGTMLGTGLDKLEALSRRPRASRGSGLDMDAAAIRAGTASAYDYRRSYDPYGAIQIDPKFSRVGLGAAGAVNRVGQAIGTMGRAAATFVKANPALFIIGAVLAFNRLSATIKDNADQVKNAREFFVGSEYAEPMTFDATSAQSIRDYVADLNAFSTELRQSTDGMMNGFADRYQGGGLSRAQQFIDNTVEFYVGAANRLEDLTRNFRDVGNDSAMIDTRTPEGITQGLELLEESGRSATLRLSALSEALESVGDAAGRTLNGLDVMRISVDAILRFQNDLQGLGFEIAEDLSRQGGQRPSVSGAGVGDALARYRGEFRTPEQIQRAEQLDAVITTITDEEIGAIERIIRDYGAASGGRFNERTMDGIREAVSNQLLGLEEFAGASDEVKGEVLDLALKSLSDSVEAYLTQDDPVVAILTGVGAVRSLAEAAATEWANEVMLGVGDNAPRAVDAVDQIERRLQWLEDAIARAREEGLTEKELSATLAYRNQLLLDLQQAEVERAGVWGEERLGAISSDDLLGRARQEVATLEAQLSVAGPNDQPGLMNELREAQQQIIQLTIDGIKAQAEMSVDPRDAEANANIEAAAIFAQMMNLEAQGLGSSAAMHSARRAFAQTVVNGARQEMAMASGTISYVQALYQNLIAAIRAFASQISGALGGLQGGGPMDSWARRIVRDRARATPAYQGAIEGLRALNGLSASVNEGLASLPSTLTDPDAFGGGGGGGADALRRTLYDPRDDVARAAAALTDARRELARMDAGSAEYHNQLQSIREAEVAFAEALRNRASATQQASADPRSNVQRAQNALRDAERAVREGLQGSTSWYQAVAQLNSAQIEFGEAVARASMNARLAGRDITDPVTMAREELRLQQSLLEQAQNRDAAPDTINELVLGSRRAENQLQQAEFDQWLGDLEAQRSLGALSDQAYIRFVQQEIARLQSYEEMTRQQYDQLIRLQQALQAAKEQVDAQFNLGDIRMPTPYEVRRAIAGGGDAFNPGSAIVSNVVNNTSTDVTNFISVDGANMDEVERMLRRLLTSGTTATYTAGSRRL